MANGRHSIKIDADIKSVRRAFTSLAGDIDKFGKKKFKMDFDDNTIKVVQKNFKTAYDNIKGQNKELVEKISKLTEEFEKASAAGKEFGQESKTALYNSLTILKSNNAELKRMEESYTRLKGFGSGMANIGAKMQHQAMLSGRGGSRLGGMLQTMGGGFGALGGAAGAVGAVLGPAAAVLGGVGAAYMGARALGGPRREMAQANLELMGLTRGGIGRQFRGAEQYGAGTTLEAIRESGLEYGIGPQEQMRSAIMLQRGAGAVTNVGQMSGFARMQRMTGLGAEELGGYAGTMRRAAVTGVESGFGENLKKLGDMYKNSMVAALDSSGALRFMETTAAMTDQIANVGTADIEGIQRALVDLSVRSDFFRTNEQRSAQLLGGFEGLTQREDIMGLNLQLLKQMGVKGDVFELQNILNRGFGTKQEALGGKSLMEVYPKEITKMVGKMFGDQELGQMPQKQLSAIESVLTKMLGFKGKGEVVQRYLESFKMTGPEAEKRRSEFETAASEALKKKGEKEEDILTGRDMTIAKNEAKLAETLIDIGDTLAPVMATLENKALDAAAALGRLAGGKTPRDIKGEIGELEERARTAGRGGWFSKGEGQLLREAQQKRGELALGEMAQRGRTFDINSQNLPQISQYLQSQGASSFASDSGIKNLQEMSSVVQNRIRAESEKTSLSGSEKEAKLADEKKLLDMLIKLTDEAVKYQETRKITNAENLRKTFAKI